MDDTQEAVLAFLADPATHGGEAVKRIDTHAAIVFLAGTRAFKVKRAVRFPFLDYSTLERRKEACEAELRINRPLAAEIYCRVLPITHEGGSRLALGGGGTPIEWAVEMRRFDENATLDHLAAAGRIDIPLADALGRAVAAAQELISRQAAQGQMPAVEPVRWVEALAGYIEEHVAAFGEAPDLFRPAEVDALTAASRAAHSRVRALLMSRGERGLIRRIHGDLHLGNVVLLDGRPVLFDAIEFSPIIGCGDVLYDLAFLLMDLTERGLQPAANIVFNRYLAETRRAEDLDALAAQIIGTAMLAVAVPAAGVAFASDVPALIAWRFLQGLLLPPIFAVTVAYIGDEWPRAEVASAAGIYVAGSSLGGFCGRFIPGVLGATSSAGAALSSLSPGSRWLEPQS
jgi:aminoglycoside phosphotransferase family enzyme